jgi:hypothetical protein
LTKRGFFLSSNSPGGEIGRHAGLKKLSAHREIDGAEPFKFGEALLF